MARYIDADALIESILKLKIVTDDMYGMGIARGIERAETAIQMQPTADVVPRSEVDNWYQLYHSIKEELKQEKMYHRETDMLCDRYYIESQQAKRQVAKEIFDEIEELAKIYTFPVVKNGVAEIAKEPFWCIDPKDFAFIKKKYTEGGE